MKKRVNIYVDEESYQRFKIQCIKEGKSISKKINDYIKSEVEKNEGVKE